MKNIHRTTAALIAITIATLSYAGDSFKEPTNEAEWKAFCQAPNYLKRAKAIQDKEQQQRVTDICLRAPWQKFKPSEKKSY